jgi:hypothetical protein
MAERHDPNFITERAEKDCAPAFGSVLLAGGCGPARVFTCERILRHIGMQVFEPLLRRALLLFRPGELQILRVAHSSTLELMVSMLVQDTPEGKPSSRALNLLRGFACQSWIEG